MVDALAEAPPDSPPAERRGRRRLWIALGMSAALLAGGAVAVVAISFHYAHAPDLVVDGLGWLPPDNGDARFVQAGPYSATVVKARPGRTQTFTVEIYNQSSVTQTILGLAYDTSQTAEPEHLTVSTSDTAVGDANFAKYAPAPTDVPPGGIRMLRISHETAGCDVWGPVKSRSESFTELFLRVRVGWFTRVEHLSFDGHALVLQGTDPPC